MLYQWGRKDGFPGADGNTIQQTEESNASMKTIYGVDGSVLTENGTGIKIEGFATTLMNGNNTKMYATKHPMTFIYNITGLRDWYTDKQIYQDNTLWADGQNRKSAYDPCPRDWRIHKVGTYNDFSTSSTPYYIQGHQTVSGVFHASNGCLYNNIAWYPAAGNRDTWWSSGKLYWAGNQGFYWYSSVTNTSGMDMTLTRDGFKLNQGNLRASGFSVRCVQE